MLLQMLCITNAGRSSLTSAQTKVFPWPLHRDNAPVTVETYPNQTRDQLNELRSLLGHRHGNRLESRDEKKASLKSAREPVACVPPFTW
ncbi:unnamed protein product [Lasius platythorax]|uniref:Uncharacterized protein n=1 Tax=Lasius platythorax TaxID=488582 RepID=A0AAV2N905_9HYME